MYVTPAQDRWPLLSYDTHDTGDQLTWHAGFLSFSLFLTSGNHKPLTSVKFRVKKQNKTGIESLFF